jgi:transposase
LAASVEAEIREALKQAFVAHFEETVLRAAKKLRCMHTAMTSASSGLFVHPKRGEDALRSADSVLIDFIGWAIHDPMPGYYEFSQAKHGVCNAHFLRELFGLIEQGSAWAAAVHAFLLELYRPERRLGGAAVLAAHESGCGSGLSSITLPSTGVG